ncbi:hypothetical protein CEP54_007669 [Fusarium duplospermum]|uniref:Methyltransferase n=1 Tax=Fusarium duplospermum TaxID=1325734 RepID=A0A428Q047_9HYPO|nr:hypothetical protein CEP54_007669 [Fusarium duplospermum]
MLSRVSLSRRGFHSAAVRLAAPFPVPPAEAHKRHVQTTLNYFKPLPNGQKPPTIYPFRPEKHDYSQWAEAVPVTVHDVAGDENEYSLDKHGFSFLHHKTKVADFSNPETIKNEYLSEMEQVLKKVTGATFVHVFNPIVRKPSPIPGKPAQGPVSLVHVDATPSEAIEGARFDLGPKADQLMKGRFQVIHAWRPLKPIYKDPFTVADARSVPQEDLVHTKVVFPNQEGSTFNVTSSPGHKFYYYRFGQTPDIITLFKSFDSKEGVACRNPDSAFVDSSTVDYPDRESIECRAYVFHEPGKN